MQGLVFEVHLKYLGMNCDLKLFRAFRGHGFLPMLIQRISYMVSRKRFFNFARIRVCLSCDRYSTNTLPSR